MKTIIKTSLVFFFLFTCFSLNAQTQQWASSYTGLFSGSVDQSWAIAVDADGNSYVTGMSDNAIATIKYNSAGVQQWAYRYVCGGRGFSIAAVRSYDNNVYIYVTGQASGANGYDYVTFKFDTYGNMLWGTPRIYNGPGNGNDIAYFVTADNSGNVYVTGQSVSSRSGVDYLTIKYDEAGNTLWTARYSTGAGNDVAYALAISGGNVYVTGTANNGASQVTLGYDPNGNLLWAASYSPGFQFVNEMHNCIAADYLHGVYITGISGSQFVTVKYDPYSGLQQWAHADYSGAGRTIGLFKKSCGSLGGEEDTWCYNVEVFVGGVIGSQYGLIKYSEDGTEQWMRQYYNFAQGHYLGIDWNGSVYLTGRINENSTLDMGTVAYSNNGTYLWNKTYSGSGNLYDNAMGLAVQSGTTNVYISGITTGAGTSQDYGTVKYVPIPDHPMTYYQGESGNTFNKVGEPPKKYSLSQNYPNPFNPETEIKFAVPADANVRIAVYDMMGKEVAEVLNEYRSTGYYSIRFDGSKLSSGVYIYRMIAGSYSETRKMMLIK